MRRGLLFAVCLMVQPYTAVAQIEKHDGGDITNTFSKSYQDCQTYGERNNTIARVDCSENELVFQDGRLNGAYKIVMARLSATRKADLRADQRNWIKARDSKCSDAEDFDKSDCLSYETIKRTRYLERVR